MEEKNNLATKILIGIGVVVVLIVIVVVSNKIGEEKEKREIEEAQQQLQETLSTLTPFGNTNDEENKTTNTEQKLDTNVDIEKLKNEQKLVCTSAKILIQDTQYKSLYPDMLSARVVNNSSEVVKSYNIVFLAYDENYLPKKIEGKYGKGGEYDYTGTDDEANLMPGATSKENYGWILDSSHGITYVIACVKSAEFFNGEKWENPYFKYWLQNYKGKILPENSRAGLIPYGQ